MTLEPGKGLNASALTTTDGRTLRYVHAGEGGPVVLFEAGLGTCASEWVTVQRLVSATTRTVSYDRAGHAGSTADTQPRSLARICEDLHALSQHVSADQPVVLVAHSWGGPVVRCYSDLHPEHVAGIVLIDTSTTGNMSPRAARFMPSIMTLMRGLNGLGVSKRLVRRSVFKNISPEVSAADRAVIDRDMTSKRSALAAADEARAVASSLPLMARWEQAGLPGVPVMNVMGGGTGGRWADLRKQYIAEAEKEMANHPQGECRVIDGTDHYVPQDKPHETAQAILDIVQKARQG